MCLYICCACCCNSVLTKTLEINLIVIHSIGVFFVLLSLIIVKWSNLPIINLILFLILFLINLACLIFIIFIRIWRSKNTIKTTNKGKGIVFSNFAFVLLILCIIACFIEDFALSYAISKLNYPCKSIIKDNGYYYNSPYYYKKSPPKIDSNEELRKLKNEYTVSECESLGRNYYEPVVSAGEGIISYFTISYLEILSIIEFILWVILKKRISLGLDGPQVINNIPPINQFRRDVVVVQPGDIVYMGGQQIAGPYMYNNGQIYPQQPYMPNSASNPIPNQYNEQAPNSNEYQLQEKVQ